MPYIIKGDSPTWGLNDHRYLEQNHDYKYPDGLKLKPGTEFHNKIRDLIWSRARESRNHMQKRFESWNEIDRTLTVYVPLSDKENQLKQKDASKPVSIVFPYSYSMLESLMTYMCMAFFQDPIFQYEGVDDDDTLGSSLLELVIRMHCIKNKVMLNIHTVLRDAMSYGIGIGIPEWVRKWGKKPRVSRPLTDGPLGTYSEDIVTWEDSLLFEGNALSNIEPYNWLPDPSVGSADIHKGEFLGWVDRTNYMHLLSEENEIDSPYFNVRYLRERMDKRSIFAMDNSLREERFGGSSDMARSITNVSTPVDRICMYINLIPEEVGLSKSDLPEKWYFELGADDVVIRCEKVDHAYDMYPMGVASPEFDGYSITPVGRLEILYGLQHTLDFLFNSHVANVRKAINDMLVVDPFLVNIEDLKDPKPGKLVRLRRPAWGRGVDKVVQQLQVNDITRMNISDSAYITQWMDRIAGADQSMAGALRMSGPERLTGAEFQGTRVSAMGRMQRIAQIIGMQFFQDIGTMFGIHTIENMQQDTFVQIAGPRAEELAKIYGGKRSARVSLTDLSINNDVIVRDGSIPGGNFSQAWLDLFKTIGTTPELIQHFDVTRIFMYIAQQLGAKNVEDFRRNLQQVQPQAVPDDVVAQQAQAGNLVPVGVQ